MQTIPMNGATKDKRSEEAAKSLFVAFLFCQDGTEGGRPAWTIILLLKQTI